MTATPGPLGAPRSVLAFLRAGRALDEQPSSRSRPRTGVRRWIALALLVIIPMVAIIGVFGGSAAHADDDKDSLQFSFYKVASSTTAFFSTEQEPGSDGFDGPWKTLIESPASAGSLLGYADPDFSPDSGWLASKLSGSSNAIGYDTLQVHNDDGSTSSRYQGMINYAYFGATLKGLGLDSSSTGLSLGFTKVITGGIVMLLFILGGAVDFVFNGVISILSTLNPFKLFYVGMSAVDPNLADGMVGNGSSDVGPLSGVANWIGGWYQTLTALSWTVMVPLFVAILIFSLLLFKKMDRGGAAKKLIVRLLFIGIGLPLLGSMYTGMIDSMSDASTSGNTGSARVVMSTYVDFENWATQSRLAVPSGATIEWNPKTQSPSGAAQADVRNTALAINNATHGTNLTAIVSANSYDASWAAQVMAGKTSDQATSADTFGSTVDMLVRYINGDQLSGATYETVSKGNLTQSAFYTGGGDQGRAEANGKTVKGWFDDLTKKADDINAYNPSSNPLVSTPANKGLTVEGTGNAVHKFTTPDYDSCKASGTKIATDDGGTRACNLTPLAMYNFLNTDFGPSSMKMYSSAAVASEATRSIHNSVTQVGTGSMSLLYLFNTVVLLGAFVFIGLGYAFALLFGSMRRSFQILSAVPIATLGSLAAIAKVLVYTIALILEVIVTIFVYKIVQEFLTSLPQLIEEPFAAVLSAGRSGAMAGFVAFLVNGWAFSAVVTVLSIVGVVGFTILAMRVRKSVVKAVEETVTKLVEKFLDTQVGMPGGGKLAPALAGGLASGAGAAMANQMMSNGKKVAVDGPNTGGKPEGPDMITSAGGSIATGPGPDGDGDHLSITAGGPAPGYGDQGSPVQPLPSGGSDSDAVSKEVALGREVEVNGLSKPGERGPRVGDDALDTATNSLDDSREGYKAADRKALAAGEDATKAAGHGAIAAGRAAAGDEAGAVQSGGKAVQAGGEAVAKAQEARQTEHDAGRSSLDKAQPQQSEPGSTPRRVSQVGGAVAGAAGAASTPASAGGGVSSSPKSLKGQTAAQPSKAAAGGTTGSPAPVKPQQPRQAPARAQQAGTSQPTPTASQRPALGRPVAPARQAKPVQRPSQAPAKASAPAPGRPPQPRPVKAPTAPAPRRPESSDK